MLLCTICAVVAIFGLSACGDGSTDNSGNEKPPVAEHTTHTPEAAVWENEVPATCTKEGSYDEVVYCAEGGEVLSSTQITVEKTAHTPKAAVRENEVPASCSTEGSYNEVIYCKVCNEIIRTTPKTIAKTYHAYTLNNNRKCSQCGDEIDYTYGLTFNIVFSNQADTYTVSNSERTKTLTEIIIPATHNGYNVTRIGSFAHCDSLTNITIPDSITNIDSYAFEDCPNLKYNEYDNALYLGNENNPYIVLVKAKSQQISECAIHDNTKIIYYSAFSGCSSLTNISIPNGVTCIGRDAFSDCSGLKNIVIPDGVTSVDYTAFKNCSKLTSIEIPDSVTSIGKDAFSGCSSLESLTMPFTYEKDSFKYGSGWLQGTIYARAPFGYFFGQSTYEGSFEIKQRPAATYDSNTQANTYYLPQSLKQLTILSLSYVPQYAFNSCINLKEVYLSDSVTSIGDYAFNKCSNLTSVIGNGITSIGNYAFGNCSSLMNITIGNDIRYIGEDAFEGCKNLNFNVFDNACYLGNQSNPYVILIQAQNKLITDCTIHDNTKIIYQRAFYNCNKLETITIPNSVTHIKSVSFERYISRIYYKGTAEDWARINIDYGVTFAGAKRYYYSETEPELNAEGTAYNGNYWHYVDDVPTVWIKES